MGFGVAEVRSCIMCGCAVGAHDSVCPMCGTPLAAASGGGTRAVRGSHAKPSGFKWLGGSRRKLVVIVGAVIVALVVVAILVLRAWLADQELHGQAADAESSGGGISAPAQTIGDAGIDSGNIAAGGIASEHDGILYETSTDGIFYRETDDLKSGDARRLGSEGAFDLNVSAPDGRIVYVAASSNGRASFEGDSISSVEMASGDSSGPSNATRVYAPDDGAKVSCLSVVGTTCYFLERSSGEYAVCKLEGESSTAEVLDTVKADSAWLFVERDKIYLATTAQGAWNVRGGAFSEPAVRFAEVAKGSGELATAAIEGGRFYYSLAAGEEDVRLQRDDLRNGSLEYPDIVNPVRVAASGDVVAALTKTGQLIWMDAVTGVAHDLTGELEKANPGLVPMNAAMSVYGEWICIADGKDGFCRINVNNGEIASSV